MTVSPMSSREGSGVRRRETPRRSTVRYGPVFKSACRRLAAPADRCESITGSGTWPGSPSSRPVMPMSGRVFYETNLAIGRSFVIKEP